METTGLEPIALSHDVPLGRGIYCNRTLNLRAVKAIGYDMDYTLIHYKVEAWEQRAYEYLQDKLVERGWPIAELRFDEALTVRGLVLDLELGNIVKTNRFGYIKQAAHGTAPLPFDQQRLVYASTNVDLADERFVFVNTLFSKSEVCMYTQLVDLLDAGELCGVMGYTDLYKQVKRHLDEAHMQGALKAEILADPERFIELDPETPLALLDQRHAGKKLLLYVTWNQPPRRVERLIRGGSWPVDRRRSGGIAFHEWKTPRRERGGLRSNRCSGSQPTRWRRTAVGWRTSCDGARAPRSWLPMRGEEIWQAT